MPVMPHVAIVVIGRTSRGQSLHRRFRANSRDHFHLQLPPGRYRLIVPGVYNTATTTLPLTSQPHATITIPPGHPAHARIVIAMK